MRRKILQPIRAFFSKKNIIFFVAALLVVGIAAFFWIIFLIKSLPSIPEIENRTIAQTTKIYDRTGQVLLYQVSGAERRTVVPLSEIPQSLKDATIAVEDQNFYHEAAFDPLAIMRALFIDLSHGHILQGGSTITQQLARSAFLSSDQTITRKVKELLLAIELNRHYSKDQILEGYLNQVPYGPSLYGVEATSEGYFGKSAKDLNIAESAMIAALPQAPTYYSPWGNHGKDLIARQQFILHKMRDLGEISDSDLKLALAYKLKFQPQAQGIKAPHFVMAVEDYLVQKYGEDAVQAGGLRVTTSLDWNLQQIAEKTVTDGVARNKSLYKSTNGSLVAEDPQTGQILALVGSRDYFDVNNNGNFDVATQGLRQPGSSLKPFVYLTAFQEGYSPNTVLFDVPTEFSTYADVCPVVVDFNNSNTKCFHPVNFEGTFAGPMSMRNALAQSENVPAVKTLYLAGLKQVLANTQKFGITTLTDPNQYGLSLVLGGGAVKLIDMVGAYSALAADGISHTQTMVLEVRDAKGNTLESFKDQGTSVSDTESVRLVNSILTDTDARRPLFSASFPLTVFSGYQVALKTGTSNDYRDAWAYGYTPHLAIGVWAGNNNNSPMQRQGSSILAAVPMWHDFMSQALSLVPADNFPPPDPVVRGKPILDGDYLAGKSVHAILYYVDKHNPTGPMPADPTADPQFMNWEEPVLMWAKANLTDFSEYNTGAVPSTGPILSAQPTSTPPHIMISSPITGSFYSDQISVSADISSANSIQTIHVYWNGTLLDEAKGSFGTHYVFNWGFTPGASNPQNLLEVEAVDSNSLSDRISVIVYRQ